MLFGHQAIAFVVFNLVVGTLLCADLALFHRHPRSMRISEALAWTSFWVALSLLFAAALPWLYDNGVGGLALDSEHVPSGRQAALQFLTGYVIELSLSVDNLFVFLAIFNFFGVQGRHQHRVLFWGIVAAIGLRAVMIFAGVALIEKFEWLIYALGGFLIVTGVKLAREGGAESDPSQNIVLRLARRWLPVAPGEHEQRFLIRVDGRLMATSLLLVLVVVNVTDVVFAMDSIPATLGVTRDPFLVYSSNFLAILGLRSLYFAVFGAIGVFVYLKYGLAAVLCFVGLKMLIAEWLPISTSVSLLVVGFFLGVSIAASLLTRKRSPTAGQNPKSRQAGQ